MTRPALRLVTPPPVEVYEQHRQEARKRDWNAVHLAGDRNPPIALDRRKWGWSGPSAKWRGR